MALPCTYQEKSASKWTCAVQTPVVHGTTVYSLPLAVLRGLISTTIHSPNFTRRQNNKQRGCCLGKFMLLMFLALPTPVPEVNLAVSTSQANTPNLGKELTSMSEEEPGHCFSWMGSAAVCAGPRVSSII